MSSTLYHLLMAVALLCHLVALPSVAGYNYCGTDVDLCGHKKHMMCDLESLPFEATYKAHAPLTLTVKAAFLIGHNEYRNKIAGGEETSGGGTKYPPAARMRDLIWDDELTYLAHVHAGRCSFKHDDCHKTSRFPVAGQNLYEGASSTLLNVTDVIESALKAWYKEKNDITDTSTIAAYSSEKVLKAGHFTAMMQDKASRVGCSLTYCVDEDDPQYKNKYHVTCDYDFNNLIGEPIYVAGDEPGDKCGDWDTSLGSTFKNLCKNTGHNFHEKKESKKASQKKRG